MGIVTAILIGAIFPFLARRKLRFLEGDCNWKVIRRGHGAIDYALKNSVLGVSYNQDLRHGRLHPATLIHVHMDQIVPGLSGVNALRNLL